MRTLSVNIKFKFYQVFSGVRVAQCLVFCVVFCRSLFVFSEVCVAQCLVFCLVLCRSLFVFSVVSVAQCLVFCVVLCRYKIHLYSLRNSLKSSPKARYSACFQSSYK